MTLNHFDWAVILTYLAAMIGLSAALSRGQQSSRDYYLAGNAFTVSQIAWLLGYREVASFSKAFKRRTGKTPRERRVAPDLNRK